MCVQSAKMSQKKPMTDEERSELVERLYNDLEDFVAEQSIKARKNKEVAGENEKSIDEIAEVSLLFWASGSILFYSMLDYVLLLQEVALCQSPPTFSVVCYPCPYHSLLPHYVISPTMSPSSNWC